MTARLLLVRHGQIAANVDQLWHGSTDSPLTPLGRRQAERVAGHLRRTRPAVAAIYSSPLQRARYTAAPIAAAFDLPVVPMAGLAEYGIGVYEGVPFADLAGQHRFFERAFGDPDWAPPEGESLRNVAARVLAAWRDIAERHPGADVVVVTHGAAMATGIASVLHDDPRAWERYRLRNTGVTEIVLTPPSLLAFDQVDHLVDDV